MTFSNWLRQKYFEWRGDRIGHSASVTEFARLFGASQPLMTEWLRVGGKVPTSPKFINALVAQYGYEVYDVLGLSRPSISSENASLLLKASRELSRSMKDRGIAIDDPKYESLFKEVFSKFGIHVERID